MAQDDVSDAPLEQVAAYDWIDHRVRAAREAAPVTESVANFMTIAMRERMGDRRLPPAELTKMATVLLELLQPKKP